jgi:hypothetical protein
MNQLTVGACHEKCAPPDVQKTANTTVVNSICKIGLTAVTSRAVITSGDGAYTIKVTSKWDGGPPVPGIAGGGHEQHDDRRQAARRMPV